MVFSLTGSCSSHSQNHPGAKKTISIYLKTTCHRHLFRLKDCFQKDGILMLGASLEV